MAIMSDGEQSDNSEYQGSDASDNERAPPDTHEPVSKKAKKHVRRQKAKKGAGFSKGLKAGEEMRALSDFETNVATLQVMDILEEAGVSERRRQMALNWFEQIRKALLNTQVSSKRAEQIKLPLRTMPDDPQLADFSFVPPRDVSLVGSFAYGVATKWSSLDVAVEMPKECFAKWDYHNCKYHRKRALYLVHLAAILQQTPTLHSKLHWRVDGDDRLPVLVVTSVSAGDLTAHILPYPESGLFHTSRFAPDKLNIQEKFCNQPANSRKPVPIYNGGVLQDMLMIPTARTLAEQLSVSSGICGGVQILKLWLRTRGLSDGADGFKGFHLTAYVDHLLRLGRLHSVMGVYQVVRAVLAQIQTEEWTSERHLGAGGDSPSVRETHKLMATQGAAAILLDRSGCHNVLYRVSAATVAALRTEARVALQSLNSGSVTLINELFTTTIPFYRKFDCYARIEPSYDRERTASLVDGWTRADFGGSVFWPLRRAMLDTLRRAFGERVLLLAERPLSLLEWDLNTTVPEESAVVEVSWNLNPDAVHHIEKGPPADSPEAQEFRNFWGEKSEIRRFQDGSILETVVWPGETADERTRVTFNICEYILRQQYRVERVVSIGEICDRVLQLPKCQFTHRYGTGDEQLVDITAKFNEFAKVLRKLPDLPLNIAAVHGVSEEFSYTAVFPQVAASCDTDSRLVTRAEGRCVPLVDQGIPKLVRPLDVLVAVECSKWPDELDVVRHMKTAFYITLAGKLEGRECQVFADHLLVLYQGLVFRVRMSCAKEIALTKQVITPEGMVRHVENKVSERLEFEHLVLPKLVSALHGLHLQHATYGPACRLAKRWLSCHLLYDAFPPLAVDLLVAYVYIQPLPFSLPHSSRAALQRFLHLLANFDWRLNPLVINFNSQLNVEALQQVNSYFTRNRPCLPPLFIRTPFDNKETSWITSEKPLGPTLRRAIVLARKALATIEEQMAIGQQGVLKAFRMSLEVYDFVIKIDERFMATHHLSVDSKHKLSFTKIRDEIPVVEFDPVKLFVENLKAAYGHLCLFFYDGYGGTDIGGLWIPKTQVPVPFKVHNLTGRKLVEPAKVLAPNYSAILSDFKILGQGLVKDVVEQRYPSSSSRSRKNSR